MNTKIWAHRGASGYRPENTIPSFQYAMELNADGVELDIQLTKDGEIVVCHDELLDRTSNAKGFLKDYTLEELKHFDFSYQYPKIGKVTIPTMKEVFELLKPSNLIINIELKTGVFDYEGIEEKIIQLTHEEGFEDRVIYSSFNHYSILKIQQLDPKAKTAFLYCDGSIDMPTYGNKYHVDALHPDFCNLRYPNFMEECKKYNLDVNVWTVNTEDIAKMCLSYGANSIITNYPDKIRKIVEEYESGI